MLRRKRRIAAILIAGFWLVMVALFLHREFGGPALAPSAGGADLAPRDQWMGIYLADEKRVGHLHMRGEAEPRGELAGYRMRMDAALETTLFGIKAAMDLGGETWSALSGERAEFNFFLRTSDTEMALQGTVADNRLTGFLHTGGQSVPLNFPVNSRLVLGGGIGMPADAMPELQPGESTTIQAFDPMAMKLARAKVTCTGEEEILIGGVYLPARIYETALGDITSRAWVGEGGEVLQASTPFGFTLRKIDPAELADAVDAGEGGGADLVQRLAVVPAGAPVALDAERLVVRVAGVDPDRFPHEPPWQNRDGDVLTIVRPPPPGGEMPPDPDFDPAPYLAGDAFVTADHPAVREKAREIVGDESDPWGQARLLHDWMYEEIDKIPVLSVPNALDVLRTREGDCNEHTVLYAALARSLGIPTRITIGLVYSDTLEGFGYHAWPQVHVRGQWHPLDPTLGQLRADATHIKLFDGGIEKWAQLAAFIGQISLEVIASE